MLSAAWWRVWQYGRVGKMLEKPDIQDEFIITGLRDEYGMQVNQVTFLPLGADLNTAVYRAETGEAAYFLKLRKGDFDELSLEIPLFLKAQGLQAIIAPLETKAGQFGASLGEYRLILYPFIEGQDGYEVALSEAQWRQFGMILRGVHSAKLPPGLVQRLPRETFSPRWRDQVKNFQFQAESATFTDPTATKLAVFMNEKRAEITRIVRRAAQLGLALASQGLEFALCHSDIHPGNLLITSPDSFYLVDWDQPVHAPKERDLVLIGGGAVWNDPREIDLFYQGYGPTEINTMALAYYRYERVIQDLAVECELMFSTSAGGDDREQEYEYFISNFLPGHEIELACKTDELLTK
jgi:spectinomycin phosphotransferase